MKRIIIDTNVYSDAMRGFEKAVSVFQRYERLLFSPVVIGELYAGFRRGGQEDKNRLQLKKLLAKERVIELSITAETADFYSYLLTALQESGNPVPTNDIWIAASAMEHGAGIATKDAHFRNILGIRIIWC